MQFKDYLDTQCNDVGQEFWKTWITQSKIELQIAIKHGYKNLREKNEWANKYCTGNIYFAGSWIFFELEEDSILFTIKWV